MRYNAGMQLWIILMESVLVYNNTIFQKVICPAAHLCATTQLPCTGSKPPLYVK